MTFKQAKKKLAKIAAGRYHMLNYQLTETKYNVTWEAAFDELEQLLSGIKPVIEDVGNLQEAIK